MIEANDRRLRLNQTIAYMLSIYVDAKIMKWHAYYHASYRLCTGMQESTKMMPLKLFYGRNVPPMLNSIFPTVRDENILDVDAEGH